MCIRDRKSPVGRAAARADQRGESRYEGGGGLEWLTLGAVERMELMRASGTCVDGVVLGPGVLIWPGSKVKVSLGERGEGGKEGGRVGAAESGKARKMVRPWSDEVH